MEQANFKINYSDRNGKIEEQGNYTLASARKFAKGIARWASKCLVTADGQTVETWIWSDSSQRVIQEDGQMVVPD